MGMNLAYGFVSPEHAEIGTKMTVDVIGKPVPTTVIGAGPYDPTNAIMRG